MNNYKGEIFFYTDLFAILEDLEVPVAGGGTDEWIELRPPLRGRFVNRFGDHRIRIDVFLSV